MLTETNGIELKKKKQVKILYINLKPLNLLMKKKIIREIDPTILK